MNEKDFQNNIEKKLEALKTGKKINISTKLQGTLPNGKKINMYVITAQLLKKEKTIKIFASWRKKSNIWFPAQFKVTLDGTKKWAVDQLLHKKDRILFFLEQTGSNTPFGHIGLYRFNYKDKSCEIDNIIRGIKSKETRGGMTIGLQLLINWTFTNLEVKKLYLSVFSDNISAIALYSRLGFKEVNRTPLIKKVEDGVISWVEIDQAKNKNVERFYTQMYLKKPSARN